MFGNCVLDIKASAVELLATILVEWRSLAYRNKIKARWIFSTIYWRTWKLNNRSAWTQHTRRKKKQVSPHILSWREHHILETLRLYIEICNKRGNVRVLWLAVYINKLRSKVRINFSGTSAPTWHLEHASCSPFVSWESHRHCVFSCRELAWIRAEQNNPEHAVSR